MPGISTHDPFRTHVQGGLRPGNYVNAEYIIIASGPPFLQDIGSAAVSDDLGAGSDVVYPIGVTQNLAISQNRAISRIFEIGSKRSYFIAGRSVGQLSLSTVVYHGPNILRKLYSYYGTAPAPGTYPIDPLYPSAGAQNPLNFPFTQGASGVVSPDLAGSSARVKNGLHGVRFPPGFGNMFLNLASDLFSQPHGLMLMIMDNEENVVASVYLEQCYVPAHSLAFDAQGVIVQESVGIQYERIVPIRGVQVETVSGILPDMQGARAF